MKFFNFNKTEKESQKIILEKRVQDATDILKMSKTNGWIILNNLLQEQLEAYKAELLVGCKDFQEYQEKRGKAWGISLLVADVADYVRMGEEAETQLKILKDS